MGERARRKRKQALSASERPAVAEAKRPAMAEGYARGRVREDAIRKNLEPLEPGERPVSVTVAAVVALLLAAANLVLMASGFKLHGKTPAPSGVIVFTLVMIAAAVGMWQARYWAVLGFEALLGVTILIAAISLMTASNLAAVALCVGIIVPSGWLFWKLIRAMARLQMPQRPGAS